MVVPTLKCSLYACQNTAKKRHSARLCMPCQDGMTTVKTFYITEQFFKRKKNSVGNECILTPDINLMEETIKKEPAVSMTTHETVSLGVPSIFNQPSTLETSGIASELDDTRQGQTMADESSEDKYNLQQVKTEETDDDSKLFQTGNEIVKKNISFCSICFLSFEEPKEYVQHLDIHCVELKDVEDGVRPQKNGYTCITCDVKYHFKGMFIRHMSVAPHNNPSFDWMFKKTGTEDEKNEETQRIYNCSGCEMEFPTKDEHHDHLKENHLDEIYRLKYIKSLVDDGSIYSMDGFYIKCDICKIPYPPGPYAFHRNEEHKGYPLQETTSTRYHAHQQKLGISQDPNICFLCLMKLPKNGSLADSHMKLHHYPRHQYSINNLDDIDNFDIPPFYCGPCARTLQSYAKYRSHLLKHHGEKVARVNQKNCNPRIKPDINDSHFFCKSCDYKFPCRPKYRQHLRKFHKMLLPKLIGTKKTN